jgi:hypothetical protein
MRQVDPFSFNVLTSARFADLHSVHVERRRRPTPTPIRPRRVQVASRPRHVTPTPGRAHATSRSPGPSHEDLAQLSRDLYKTRILTGSAKGPVEILQFFWLNCGIPQSGSSRRRPFSGSKCPTTPRMRPTTCRIRPTTCRRHLTTRRSTSTTCRALAKSSRSTTK